MRTITGLIVLCFLVSCAVPVRAYPPKNAEGQMTPLPVVMAKSNGTPVEPGFLGLDLSTALFGVKVGGDMLKGGARSLIEKRKAKHG